MRRDEFRQCPAFRSGSDEPIIRNRRTTNPNWTESSPGMDNADHALFPRFAPELVATALKDGIHAGTGALRGIPLQLPNRMMVQNVNPASGRLCNSLFMNCWVKWKITARPTRPNQTRFRLPEYHQAKIACVTPRTGVLASSR